MTVSAAPPTSPAQPPALLLAAGRGERMRPLTDHQPKPLLTVGERSLLAWHLLALARAGVRHAVINTAWLGEQIEQALGDVWLDTGPAAGACPGDTRPVSADTAAAAHAHQHVHLHYSREGTDFGRALETLGGICRAMPMLRAKGDDVFWLAAGDVYAPGFGFHPADVARFRAGTMLAHLWLVPNPAHHPQGDFGLGANGLALNLPAADPAPRCTYATIGLYRAALFAPPWCDIAPGNPAGVVAPLAPLLRRAMDAGRVSAQVYAGAWTDVGTPDRLAALNAVFDRSGRPDDGTPPRRLQNPNTSNKIGL